MATVLFKLLYAAAEKELGLEIICPPQPPPPAKTPASAQTAAPGETEPPLVESTTRGGKRVKASRRASQEVRERMKAKARSPEGRRWLRVRRTTVEPTFGLIKSVLGFRRFHLRGLAKANVEWQLVALAFNCRRVSPVYAQTGALPN